MSHTKEPTKSHSYIYKKEQLQQLQLAVSQSLSFSFFYSLSLFSFCWRWAGFQLTHFISSHSSIEPVKHLLYSHLKSLCVTWFFGLQEKNSSIFGLRWNLSQMKFDSCCFTGFASSSSLFHFAFHLACYLVGFRVHWTVAWSDGLTLAIDVQDLSLSCSIDQRPRTAGKRVKLGEKRWRLTMLMMMSLLLLILAVLLLLLLTTASSTTSSSTTDEMVKDCPWTQWVRPITVWSQEWLASISLPS